MNFPLKCTCHHCGNTCITITSRAGRAVKCTGCGHSLLVPLLASGYAQQETFEPCIAPDTCIATALAYSPPQGHAVQVL